MYNNILNQTFLFIVFTQLIALFFTITVANCLSITIYTIKYDNQITIVYLHLFCTHRKFT